MFEYFFDEFFEADLWGKELGDYLDEIYRKRSRFIIIFVSKEYKGKKWTDHERRSALSAAIESDIEKVLPIKVDDTELKGLRNSTSYIRASDKTPSQIANLLLQKLKSIDQPLHSIVPKNNFSVSLWRLVDEKHIDDAFSGLSAKHFGGRWNTRGQSIVYASSSLALASLELLIHTYKDCLSKFVAIEALFPRRLQIHSITIDSLPNDWEKNFSLTQKIGDEWVNSRNTCVLSVPSVVLPRERNYLINPNHFDFDKIVIVSKEYVNLDERFIR
nr:RES domain-containing protein [Desulfobacula sp.]